MMPLHKACQYGHVRCVEELLKLGGESQILEQNAVYVECVVDITVVSNRLLAVWFNVPALGGKRFCTQQGRKGVQEGCIYHNCQKSSQCQLKTA